MKAVGLGRARTLAATAAVMAIATVAVAGCGLTGPGNPERTVVGTYHGQWHFGIYDADTIGRGTAGGGYQGFIACPGFIEIAKQDGKDIRGSFGVSTQGATSCTSQQSNFCSASKIAAFCRAVSGTLEGQAFSTGSPSAETILYEFQITIAGQRGRSALSRLTGCNVVGALEDWFSGGVTDDITASAYTAVTAECGGYADLQRVDLSLRLDAARR